MDSENDANFRLPSLIASASPKNHQANYAKEMMAEEERLQRFLGVERGLGCRINPRINPIWMLKKNRGKPPNHPF